MSQPSQQSSYSSPAQSPQLPHPQPHQQPHPQPPPQPSQQHQHSSQQAPHYPPQYNPRPYPPSVYPPRDYNTPQSIGSPYANPIPPASKRQRLSPNPQSPYSSQSPYNSPGLANIQLPNQVFSSPYYGSHMNGNPPSNGSYYNTINNPPPTSAPPNSAPSSNMPNQAGSMGPPSRPNDKPTDVADLSDVLAGSGVDLREEEAALMRATQKPGNVPPRSDLNYYSGYIPGGADSFYGAGAFNQPAVSLETAEEHAKAAAERRVTERAQRNQHHLNNPFLLIAPLERRLRKEHHKEQVPYNNNHVLERQPNVEPQTVFIVGPDGNEALVTLKDQTLLDAKAPIVDILALLSLACEERIRVMLEKAAAAAHNRCIGSQHVVPYGLQDLATGDGEPETVPVPNEGEMAITGKPPKRSYPGMNPEAPTVLDGVHLPTTIKYPNEILQKFHESAVAEREEYIDMLWERHKRDTARATKEAQAILSAASSPAGQVAPDSEATKKGGLKKEARKQLEAKASEAQQAAATNKTMQMALGKKGPSWLTGGGFKGGASSAGPARSGTTLSKGTPKSRADIAASLPPVRPLGQVKEKKTIDMRDIMFVMEGDTAAKRILGMCYLRRNSPGGMAKGWN